MEKTLQEPIADNIAKILAERIIRGEMQADEKLRQDHIAIEFSTSHVPVREAFRRLEAMGLVVSLPRRGVRVSSFTKDDMREVAQMRASLEALALRHAAPHLTPAILEKAEELTSLGEAARDVATWEDANRQFHRSILAPCNMPRLMRTIDELHIASARFVFSGWRAEWEAPSDRDHRAILDALRKNNIDLAVSVLAHHIDWKRA